MVFPSEAALCPANKEDRTVSPAPVDTVLVDIHDRRQIQSFHFEMFQGCRSYSLNYQSQVGNTLLDMQSNQTLDALYCSTFQLDIACTLQHRGYLNTHLANTEIGLVTLTLCRLLPDRNSREWSTLHSLDSFLLLHSDIFHLGTKYDIHYWMRSRRDRRLTYKSHPCTCMLLR